MAEEQRRSGMEAAEGDVLPWTVAEFYRGQSVLLTGGSGFVGRVLLEKLLFCCPDIDTVYVLLRPRKGLSVQERLHKLLDVPLFERVRAQRPEALGRLQAVEGDSAQPDLALAEADARVLAERVSVVFHLAASVRFDDPLITAVRTNACATRDLLQLATRMTKLKAFVHVSTTFCNEKQRDEKFGEQLYPVAGDWRSILALVEAQGQKDPVAIRALTTKILGPHCNTYTFTKNLAEHIVDHYSDRLPVGILRPSVVVGTALDPFPGWIDNFNGPMGMLVGAAKGVVHYVYTDPHSYTDYIPCDVVVKGLVMSSCDIAKKGVGPPLVYQGATVGLQHVTQRRILELAYEAADLLPFTENMYHPCGGITHSRLLFYMYFMCFNLLPAVIGDALLSATGRKPMLVRLQRRIYSANMALAFFLIQTWDFLNNRFMDLEKKLRPEDVKDFSYQIDNLVPEAFFRDALLGTRRFLMKEPDSNLPEARRAYKRKHFIHLFLKTLFYAAISWMILSKLRFLLFAE